MIDIVAISSCNSSEARRDRATGLRLMLNSHVALEWDMKVHPLFSTVFLAALDITLFRITRP